MKCAEVGLLRAYVDGELAAVQREALGEHLATCEGCRRTLAELTTGTTEVRWALDALAPAPEETVLPAVALRAFRGRERSRPGVWQRLQEGVFEQMNAFSTRWRVGTAAMAAVILAFVLVATPAGSAVAGWLSVFRAEKFAPVTIDPSATATAKDVNPEDFGTFEVLTEPKVEHVANAAAAQVGFAVRQPGYLPAGLKAAGEASVSTPAEVVFRFDRAKSQAAFASLGLQVNLPQSVEGAKARVYVPAGVQQGWVTGSEGSQSGLAFMQNPSPTVELPGFLESKATRELFYSVAGLSPEMVSQVEGFVESGNTAPVPVMKGDTATQVAVDGTQGVLVSHKPAVAGKNAPEGSYLVWQKGGVVYVLGGTFGTDELLKVANSLK